MFQVLYTSEAKERLAQIAKFDSKSARIIFDHIKRLPESYKTDPFLKGPRLTGLRRNRIGRYRFVYRVLEREKEIHIITVNLRKSIYG